MGSRAGASVSDMALRTGHPGDESLLRELRIAALTDAPAAFGSTLQRESARTVEDWSRWFSPGVTFFWMDDAGEAGGLVAAVVDGDGLKADLVSMWVRPDQRGQGVGDAMVTAVVAWAQQQGLALRLHVVEDNSHAERLYERHGFRPTADVDVRPDGVREVKMTYDPR